MVTGHYDFYENIMHRSALLFNKVNDVFPPRPAVLAGCENRGFFRAIPVGHF
jgi:hypothetical protein